MGLRKTILFFPGEESLDDALWLLQEKMDICLELEVFVFDSERMLLILNTY